MPALRHQIRHLISLVHQYASRRGSADMKIIWCDEYASIRISRGAC